MDTNPNPNNGEMPPAPVAGVTVEQETSPRIPPGPYGPNNENLPDELVGWLQYLQQQFSLEEMPVRNYQIRRCAQARNYFDGKQHMWWDEISGMFRLPNEAAPLVGNLLASDAASQPVYDYTTNIVKPYGRSLIAALSPEVPPVQFFPENPHNEDDIEAAKSKQDLVDYIARENGSKIAMQDIVYKLLTDGVCYSYSHFVTDAQRYGYEDQPILGMESRTVGEDSYQCPQCATQTPASASRMGAVSCPSCGKILTADNYIPSPVANVPVQQGTQKIPRGMQRIDYHGAMEVKAPFAPDDFRYYPYLQLQMELEYSILRAKFPHVASKITNGSGISADDNYARLKRMDVKAGHMLGGTGETVYSLVTYLETWIQPFVFYRIEDEQVRTALLNLFPDGCACQFAGETYCGSRNESLIAHWRVMHATPGTGQVRPGLLWDILPVQDQLNDLGNICQEDADQGAAVTLIDSETIDADQWQRQEASRGGVVFVNGSGPDPLANKVHQFVPTKTDETIIQRLEFLFGPCPQFILGAQPALFGAELKGNDTASGYSMARDQAMGFQGPVWARMVKFYGETMEIAADEMRDNMTQDISYAVVGSDEEIQAKTITAESLKGNAKLYLLEDANYPQSWTSKRANLLQVTQAFGQSPVFQQTMEDPDNIEEIKETFALTLKITGEDSRVKQRAEIKELMQSDPVPVEPSPQDVAMALQTGQQPQPQFQSSVPIDPVMDDHAVEFSVVRKFCNSQDGQALKRNNPNKFENIRLHGIEHQQALAAQQAAQVKPPAESINFKDQPASGKVQMDKQAGIQISPQDVGGGQPGTSTVQ